MGIRKYKVGSRYRWKVSFKHRGVLQRKQGFTSLREAEEWKVEERQRLERLPTDSLSFGALADEYVAYCKARFRWNTVRQKHHVYTAFLEFIGGDRGVEEVAAKDIEGYVTDLAGWNPKTANRHLRDIKALYRWAFDRDLVAGRNPCKSIRKFPENPYLPYVPPIEDYKKVLLVASRDEQDFLETIYHTVSRRREILRLTWADVDLEKGWVRTYTRKRQGGALEPMDKPMNTALRKILKARHERRDKRSQNVFHFEQTEVDRMMASLCASAGVKPFGFHALRHLAASNLVNAGVDMRVAQKLLGHKRFTTTETYVHTLDEALKKAVEKLERDQNGGSTQKHISEGARPVTD